MGKFSEALKKAEREDGFRPLGQEKEQLSPGNAIPTSNPRKMPKQSDKAVSAAGPVKDKKEVETLKADPPVKPEVKDADPAVVKKQDDDRHVDQAHQKTDHENTTVALVGTPAPEEATPAEPSVNDPVDKGRMQEHPKGGAKTSGSEIQINYSKTKVQVADLEKLKNNKIFSLFDEIETTDQIRILRTQVLRKLKAIGGNSILVTSSNPYEGKTFTSINLGVSIAKEFNRTVLIIDADIRTPTQHHTAFSTEFFSLKVEKGLTDYLYGDVDISDILINPGIDRLTLIPGGIPVNNSPELLNSGRMEVMMSEIKSRYPSDRLVIVDGPAMLPFPDAMILSRYVDGVLPVIESEKTSTEDLKKMMNLLKEVNILGVVFNKNRG
jgi:non-specific protein-tyrosine kinase